MRDNLRLMVLFSVLTISIRSVSAQVVPTDLPVLKLPEPPTELSPTSVVGQQPHPIDSVAFIDTRSVIGQFASTVVGDHEFAGYLTNGGGPYSGVIAYHLFYTEQEFTLKLPPGATHPQTLFAPTTRAPNGGCLEMGTAYVTNPGEPTHTSVYAYDFCNGKKFGRQIAIDKNFLKKYSASNSAGQKYYIASIVTNAPTVGVKANWNGAFFNFLTGSWDIFFSSTGLSDDQRGWSIFETWFQKGQCSKSLPALRAWNVQFKNLDTGLWEGATQNMSRLTVNQLDGKSSDSTNTNCFNDDETGSASYNFTAINPNSAWEVRSTGN